jgi:hypothetical protein
MTILFILKILSLHQATTWRTNIRGHLVIDPLEYQLPDHPHERRMRPGRRGPHHLQPNLIRDFARHDIKIVNHFHVIRNKPDRRDHDASYTFAMQHS